MRETEAETGRDRGSEAISTLTAETLLQGLNSRTMNHDLTRNQELDV